MGLFDFFRRKKKMKKIEETGTERSLPQTLDGFDPNTVTPPDTRYTQEYQDFLAAQEAGGQNRELSDDSGTDAVAESPAEKETPVVDTEEVPPCTACGEETEPAETPDVDAEEVPSCTACGEETEPAETPDVDAEEVLRGPGGGCGGNSF